MMAALGLGLGFLAHLTPHLTQLYASSVFIGIAGTGTYQTAYPPSSVTGVQGRHGMRPLIASHAGDRKRVDPAPALGVESYFYGSDGATPTWCLRPSRCLWGRRSRSPLLARHGALSHRNTTILKSSGVTSGMAWPQAVTSLSFWLLALGVCALSLSENGALAHLAPMLSQHGLTPRDVALTASLLGVSSVIGRFILGWLLDYPPGSETAVVLPPAAGAGMFLLDPRIDILGCRTDRIYRGTRCGMRT